MAIENRAEHVTKMISDQEIVSLETELVKITSYTKQETELAEFIVEYLRSENIEAHLQEVPIPDALRTEEDPAVTHNVVGKIPGSGDGPSLLFNGHMDHRTERTFDDWEYKPFDPVIEDGRLYGKGAQDEKGGICAMLAAATAIERSEITLDGDVYFCPVAGHKSMSFGTKHLVEVGPQADYGINTENSGNWIVPAHIGILKAEVQVGGVHPRTRFWIPETMNKATGFKNATRLIQHLGEEGVKHPDNSWLSFPQHSLLSEFPAHHVDYIDKKMDAKYDHINVGLVVLTVPGVGPETSKRDLQRVLQTLENEYSDFVGKSVSVTEWGPPLDVPFDSPVIQSLSTALTDESGTKSRIGIEGRLGTFCCASIMDAHGIETCVFGPGSRATTQEFRQRYNDGVSLFKDEYIELDELLVSARTMARTAVDLCTAE